MIQALISVKYTGYFAGPGSHKIVEFLSVKRSNTSGPCVTHNTSSRFTKNKNDLFPSTVRTISCGINHFAGAFCSA